jgi:DNA-binding MarR family transcriptional regulator
MDRENPPDHQVEDWLKTLGIESLCQWDVLEFLYHHPISLFGEEHLASRLGYASGPVVVALDVLESLRLVERSRVSQGVRLYRFTVPADRQRGDASERLFALANSRAGRVVLSKKLRAGDRTPREGLQAAQRFPEEAT